MSCAALQNHSAILIGQLSHCRSRRTVTFLVVQPLLKCWKSWRIHQVIALSSAAAIWRCKSPFQLLDFKISVLVPLTIIEEQIALWRAIFAGGITITMLILGLAHLRSRMLQERSDAIEMARHNQAYIREVIQHTQAGLVTLNDQSEIEALNPAVENLLSCSLSGLIGRPLSSLFHVSEKDRVRWVKSTAI